MLHIMVVCSYSWSQLVSWVEVSKLVKNMFRVTMQYWEETFGISCICKLWDCWKLFF